MAANNIIMKEEENRSDLLLKTFYKLVNAIMSKTDDPERDLRSIMGLSLSYDIVKAHGGELKMETKEGKGAEFIIILPDS